MTHPPNGHLQITCVVGFAGFVAYEAVGVLQVLGRVFPSVAAVIIVSLFNPLGRLVAI